MYPAAILLAFVASDPEPEVKPTKPRELAAAGFAFAPGQPTEPRRISTEKELAAVLADKAARAALLKKVDLRKEHLLLFTWAGSGGDRVEPAAGAAKAGEAAFIYRPGVTFDLVQHTKLFAIPARAKPKVTQMGP
jgi:hypothetical protein